ncbi:RNA polymerase II subunit A C-terminal domain phosphatase [Nematocida displodere]|uniref:RNA polymerase II subunit A C-terminal domain phosphatase n=1 Tax=Nematocida displodere TaxID=1805483 RepID=A0A177EDF8_9MICR|nr:RNA polymerase II subunit A C-terminal domain phosphatase [Nematocida displodere]
MVRNGECLHSVQVHGLCAHCGQEVSKKGAPLFVALHNNTGVLFSVEEAERHNEASYARLTGEKRMILLLDLDQTIIHTSILKRFSKYYEELVSQPPIRETREERAIREVKEISIDGFKYYVKLRDGLECFLARANEYFEIHVYTMGNRPYGEAIARIIDPERKYFGTRIVTRDDNLGCFEKDLKRLFPTNSKNVVILDDRPDVWGFCSNLFPVRPYTFFKTGDINSPEVLRLKGGRREEEAGGPASENDGLVDQIVSECVASLYDNELSKIMGHLLSIHQIFFSRPFQTSARAEAGVVSILADMKSIFKGCIARVFSSSFDVEKFYLSLFEHYGGSADVYVSKRTTHVIISEGGTYIGPPPRKNIKYVNINWVHESIFALKRLNEENFTASPDSCACDGGDSEESTFSHGSNDSLYEQILHESIPEQ